MTGGSGNIDEDRLIDEALNKISKGNIRIEDMNRMADITSALIDSLARDVLTKIIDDIKEQSVWSMRTGGRPPDFTSLHFTIQGRVLAFVTALLNKWEYVTTQSMKDHAMKEMKKVMDDGKK